MRLFSWRRSNPEIGCWRGKNECAVRRRKFEGDPYCVIPEELGHTEIVFALRRCLMALKCRKVKFFSAWNDDQSVHSKWLVPKKRWRIFNKTATQIREAMRENVKNGLIGSEDAAETDRRYYDFIRLRSAVISKTFRQDSVCCIYLLPGWSSNYHSQPPNSIDEEDARDD